MSSSIQKPAKVLPPKPCEEHLRKEAKRLARDQGVRLTAAQRTLAHEYGYENWATLIAMVQSLATGPSGGDASEGSSPSSEHRGGKGDCEARLYPLLPLRELVTFPHVSYPIFVGRSKSIRALQYAHESHVPIVLATQKDGKLADPVADDIYAIGTIGNVVQAVPLPDGTMKTIIEAKCRVVVTRFILDDDCFKAEITEVDERATADARLENLVPVVIAAYVNRRAKLFGEENVAAWAVPATTADGASTLADRVASKSKMQISQKQALLELTSPAERLEKILRYLNTSD